MNKYLVGPIAVVILAFPFPAAAQRLAATRPGVPDTSPFRPLAWAGPNSYRTASGMPGPNYWQQKADYTIKASLEPSTQTIQGSETITYTNNSPDTLRFVWLQLDMNLGSRKSRNSPLDFFFFPEDSTFHVGATIERIQAVHAGAGGKSTSATLSWWVNSTMMRVDLDRPLAPKGVLSLDIGWHYQVPTQGGRTGRQQFPEGWLYQIAQWYPRMAVYDDISGWDTLPYLGQEFYLEYGTFDYAVTLPADMLVAGSGELLNPAEVLTPLERERLVQARASDKTVMVRTADDVVATLPANGSKTWRFHMDRTRDVSFAASRAFVWDAARIDLPGGKTALAQSVYPAEDGGDAAWGRSTEYLKFAVEEFSRRWFVYPWPNAINVGGPVGGMEYPALLF
ncbi:MAG TPA: hypothetical protein VNX15_03650, partial [Gemmatimonadales bacterium]|nr:hypothetical protein [Gemmatimonadales bacterium]